MSPCAATSTPRLLSQLWQYLELPGRPGPPSHRVDCEARILIDSAGVEVLARVARPGPAARAASWCLPVDEPGPGRAVGVGQPGRGLPASSLGRRRPGLPHRAVTGVDGYGRHGAQQRPDSFLAADHQSRSDAMRQRWKRMTRGVDPAWPVSVARPGCCLTSRSRPSTLEVERLARVMVEGLIERLAAEPAVPAISLLDNLADQLQQAANLRRLNVRRRMPRSGRPASSPATPRRAAPRTASGATPQPVKVDQREHCGSSDHRAALPGLPSGAQPTLNGVSFARACLLFHPPRPSHGAGKLLCRASVSPQL